MNTRQKEDDSQLEKDDFVSLFACRSERSEAVQVLCLIVFLVTREAVIFKFVAILCIYSDSVHVSCSKDKSPTV